MFRSSPTQPRPASMRANAPRTESPIARVTASRRYPIPHSHVLNHFITIALPQSNYSKGRGKNPAVAATSHQVCTCRQPNRPPNYGKETPRPAQCYTVSRTLLATSQVQRAPPKKKGACHGGKPLSFFQSGRLDWPTGPLRSPYGRTFGVKSLPQNLFPLRSAAKPGCCVVGEKGPRRALKHASGPFPPAALPPSFSLDLVTKQVLR
jgi:hypothetical protein